MTGFTVNPTWRRLPVSGGRYTERALPAQPQFGMEREAAPGTGRGELARLLHEVRQPLCGIESIAYYLEIALESENDEIRQQCDLLRAMVRQANWLLDDAAIESDRPDHGSATVSLNDEVFCLAERLALHEERALELDLARGVLRAHAPWCGLRRLAGHVLSFLHEVAEAEEPVEAATAESAGWHALRFKARVNPERCGEFGKLLTVLRPAGLVGAMEKIGGQVEVTAEAGVIEVELRFPPAQDK